MNAGRTLGVKHDGEKPRWDLLLQGMPLALEEVVRVLTYGSEKYADHNWRYVDRADQRYLAAGMRHEAALQSGEIFDPETGLHHLAHKLCCDLFRLELAMRSDWRVAHDHDDARVSARRRRKPAPRLRR